MEYILDAIEAKEVDDYSINKIGIPSVVLMERASLAVADEVSTIFFNIANHKKGIIIVANTGNNGADGLAVARILNERNLPVKVKILGHVSSGTTEFKLQYNILSNLKVDIADISEYVDYSDYSIVVDAIFGIGLNREVEGLCATEISNINNSDAQIISVDIPSGINATTSQVMGVAVKADATITFGTSNLGITLNPGRKFAGTVKKVDIGFPRIAYDNISPKVFTYNKDDIVFPLRDTDSNKGSYGKLLIFAGSETMSGAAYLSAYAAYRMGTGLVKVVTVKENRAIIQQLLPEVLFTDIDDTKSLKSAIEWSDVIIAGPGIGNKSDNIKRLEMIISSQKPLILDADALNMISDSSILENCFHNNIIVTPHLGEMSRLISMPIEIIKSDIIDKCKSYAYSHNVICVLKDSRTIVCDGYKVYINTSGNSGMSTAGSGDVLTGIIGALICAGLSLYKASTLGVYLHGLAGDAGSLNKGERNLMATDIIEHLWTLTK